MQQLLPSSWKDNLDEKPQGRYKFASVELDAPLRVSYNSRQTYNLLDWLSDIGGLADGLYRLI